MFENNRDEELELTKIIDSEHVSYYTYNTYVYAFELYYQIATIHMILTKLTDQNISNFSFQRNYIRNSTKFIHKTK